MPESGEKHFFAFAIASSPKPSRARAMFMVTLELMCLVTSSLWRMVLARSSLSSGDDNQVTSSVGNKGITSLPMFM